MRSFSDQVDGRVQAALVVPLVIPPGALRPPEVSRPTNLPDPTCAVPSWGDQFQKGFRGSGCRRSGAHPLGSRRALACGSRRSWRRAITTGSLRSRSPCQISTSVRMSWSPKPSPRATATLSHVAAPMPCRKVSGRLYQVRHAHPVASALLDRAATSIGRAGQPCCLEAPVVQKPKPSGARAAVSAERPQDHSRSWPAFRVWHRSHQQVPGKRSARPG
jgi:hypothetical protein